VVTKISEAKARLSQLVERAERGETIIIGRNDRPVAMLVPYQETREPRGTQGADLDCAGLRRVRSRDPAHLRGGRG